MAKRARQSWTPAESFKVTRLPPNGPKPGQSVDAFLFGKDKAYERLVDNPNTTFRNHDTAS